MEERPSAIHQDVVYESDKYPEDVDEKDIELPRRAGRARAHGRFLERGSTTARSRWPTSSRAISRRRAASWPTSRSSSALWQGVNDRLAGAPAPHGTAIQHRARAPGDDPTLRVTLSAGGFDTDGYWRAYVWPYRVQSEAIQVVLDAGGTVQTRPAGPAWLRRLWGEDRIHDGGRSRSGELRRNRRMSGLALAAAGSRAIQGGAPHLGPDLSPHVRREPAERRVSESHRLADHRRRLGVAAGVRAAGDALPQQHASHRSRRAAAAAPEIAAERLARRYRRLGRNGPGTAATSFPMPTSAIDRYASSSHPSRTSPRSFACQ
jgi:hypothetical protein